jgi:hypothetical protein
MTNCGMGDAIVQLRPGIAEVNIAEFGDPVAIPISPYVQVDVPITDSGDGFCCPLDQNLVDNPLKTSCGDSGRK